MHHCSRKSNLSLCNTFIKDSLKHGTKEGEHSCWLHFFPPPICSSNLCCISTLKAMRHARRLTVRILSGRTTSCPVILQALVRHPLNLPTYLFEDKSHSPVIQQATFTLPPSQWCQELGAEWHLSFSCHIPPYSLPPVQFKIFISV